MIVVYDGLYAPYLWFSPLMFFGLEILTVLAETPVLKWLLKIDWKLALFSSLAANLASSVLGIVLLFLLGVW